MPIPEKDDVVFIEGWGGIIGIVQSYDEKGLSLNLELPKLLVLPKDSLFVR